MTLRNASAAFSLFSTFAQTFSSVSVASRAALLPLSFPTHPWYEASLAGPAGEFSGGSLVLLALVASFALTSLGFLALARRAVDAIFAFLGYLLALALAFFALGSDYLGSIIFVVYLGAIVIFFIFVLFTMEPRWFISTGALGDSSAAALGALVTFTLYLALLLRPLWALLAQGTPPFVSDASAFLPLASPALPGGIQSFSASLYGDYGVLTAVLGLLLLLALGLAMELLVDRSEAVRPGFSKHFVFFGRRSSR